MVLATEEPAPYLHDLVRLTGLAGIEHAQSQRRSLGTISGFNLKARYDDQKETFRKQATRVYAKQYLKETASLRLWLQKIPPRVRKLVAAYLDDLEHQTRLPIERAIIYGSYAKGTPHRWSDIDLCIISKRFRNRSQAVDYLMRRRGVAFCEISPVGFPPRDFTPWDPLTAEIRRYDVRVR